MQGCTSLQDHNHSQNPLLCCMQGGRSGANVELKTVQYYDDRKRIWQEVAGLQLARTSLTAVSLGDHLYAIGGQAGKAVYSSAECFDPTANRWSLLGASMHVERKYASSAVLGGMILLCLPQHCQAWSGGW